MKILIIGASGFIGGNCYTFFTQQEHTKVTGTYRTYNKSPFKYFDPLDELTHKLLHQKWDAVIHTGALSNVDLCEQEIEDSFINNVQSTKIIVDNLKNSSAHFIFLSTDYVFDGKQGPYAEDALPNPINVYGKHKLMAEKYIRENMPNHAIVRVTNVYGEEDRKKNFLARLIQQIEENGLAEIKAAADQFATPVYANDIAKSIYAIIQQKGRGIFHVAGNDYYSRYQITQKIVDTIFERRINIVPTTTKALKQKALRPLKGGLVNNRMYELQPDLTYMSIDSYIASIARRNLKEMKRTRKAPIQKASLSHS